ncbi:MAG: ParB/RepB/Spo0J family partition protein [Cryobacterium sp.]|nr:ParB/RepB/Spo0J family partition protein [Oligoflexia bacterium]
MSTIPEKPEKPENSKIKTREGSGYLKQLYATARVTAGSTHSNLKSLTTFLVNFVPVEKVDASELQVRTHFDDHEVATLANSIKLHGVLQPILVVQDGDRYKVIAGERRLRASKMAGMDRIPARVLATDDKATHEIALRENLDRVDLHPIEEGEGYVSLLEAGAYSSHDSIAKSFMKPKSRITECIGFTKLPTDTKVELMKRGVKNRALLRVLLTTNVANHFAMIEEASQKEETLLDAAGVPLPPEAAAKIRAEKAREAKSFSFKMDENGLSVPGFKWKSTDNQDQLTAYADSLKKIIEQIEERLTRP